MFPVMISGFKCNFNGYPPRPELGEFVKLELYSYRWRLLQQRQVQQLRLVPVQSVRLPQERRFSLQELGQELVLLQGLELVMVPLVYRLLVEPSIPLPLAPEIGASCGA